MFQPFNLYIFAETHLYVKFDVPPIKMYFIVDIMDLDEVEVFKIAFSNLFLG